MKQCYLTSLLLTLVIVAYSQETEKVKEAMMNYLKGFYTGDSSLIMASIDTSVYKYGYYLDKGVYKGSRMSFKEMIAFTRNVRNGSIKFPNQPRAEVVVFEVNDKTASGKVYAEWGFDYMLLAKIDGRWLIRQILWQNYPPKN